MFKIDAEQRKVLEVNILPLIQEINSHYNSVEFSDIVNAYNENFENLAQFATLKELCRASLKGLNEKINSRNPDDQKYHADARYQDLYKYIKSFVGEYSAVASEYQASELPKQPLATALQIEPWVARVEHVSESSEANTETLEQKVAKAKQRIHELENISNEAVKLWSDIMTFVRGIRMKIAANPGMFSKELNDMLDCGTTKPLTKPILDAALAASHKLPVYNEITPKIAQLSEILQGDISPDALFYYLLVYTTRDKTGTLVLRKHTVLESAATTSESQSAGKILYDESNALLRAIRDKDVSRGVKHKKTDTLPDGLKALEEASTSDITQEMISTALIQCAEPKHVDYLHTAVRIVQFLDIMENKAVLDIWEKAKDQLQTSKAQSKPNQYQSKLSTTDLIKALDDLLKVATDASRVQYFGTSLSSVSPTTLCDLVFTKGAIKLLTEEQKQILVRVVLDSSYVRGNKPEATELLTSIVAYIPSTVEIIINSLTVKKENPVSHTRGGEGTVTPQTLLMKIVSDSKDKISFAQFHQALRNIYSSPGQALDKSQEIEPMILKLWMEKYIEEKHPLDPIEDLVVFICKRTDKYTETKAELLQHFLEHVSKAIILSPQSVIKIAGRAAQEEHQHHMKVVLDIFADQLNTLDDMQLLIKQVEASFIQDHSYGNRGHVALEILQHSKGKKESETAKYNEIFMQVSKMVSSAHNVAKIDYLNEIVSVLPAKFDNIGQLNEFLSLVLSETCSREYNLKVLEIYKALCECNGFVLEAKVQFDIAYDVLSLNPFQHFTVKETISYASVSLLPYSELGQAEPASYLLLGEE